MTKEQKKALSEKSKAMWNNKEFRRKNHEMRTAEDSPYKSKEFRLKMSEVCKGEKNPNFNNRWTNEQKKRLSQIKKDKGLHKDNNNPKATSIICLETGEVFPLIKNAMEKYNVKHTGSFTLALKHRERTASGLHWLKFSDELLDENIRFKELLKSISLSLKPIIICVETKEIIGSKEKLRLLTCMSARKFKKEFKENNIINYNNKTYMYVKDYYSRYMQ